MIPTPPRTRRSAGLAMQFSLGAAVLVAPHAQRALTYRLYGLAILLLPALLGAVAGVHLSPWQRGWLSLALAVHAFGALYALYLVPWYDHLAHVASAMLVAGVAYAAVRGRGLDRGRERSRDRGWNPDRDRAPSVRTHLLVLGVVLVVGGAWELWETQVDYLTVYGPADVAYDVLFDGVGWLLAVPARRRLVGRLPEVFRESPGTDD